MIKCPYCGYEGEFRLIKTWKYKWWNVYFYECPKCGGRFRWQVDQREIIRAISSESG